MSSAFENTEMLGVTVQRCKPREAGAFCARRANHNCFLSKILA
jgi:hypothetical protein